MRHSLKDGRGFREILVNGKVVERCYWADDVRGIAKCISDPVTIDKSVEGYRLRTCAHFGKVEVRYLG